MKQQNEKNPASNIHRKSNDACFAMIARTRYTALIVCMLVFMVAITGCSFFKGKPQKDPRYTKQSAKHDRRNVYTKQKNAANTPRNANTATTADHLLKASPSTEAILVG